MAGSPKDKSEQTLAQFKMIMPAADYAVLAEPPSRVDRLMQMTREAMAQGTKGAVWDMHHYVSDWDFHLEEIQMHLKVFHGKQDRNVPLAAVRKAMALLPNAELVTYKNEAELSTLCNHLSEFAPALINRQ